QTDQLTVRHARRDGDPHGVVLQLQCAVRFQLRTFQLQRSRRASKGLLEVDVDPCVMVARGASLSAPKRIAAGGAAAKSSIAEQGREEIAEAFRFLELLHAGAVAGTCPALTWSPAELKATSPVRRWPELLS